MQVGAGNERMVDSCTKASKEHLVKASLEAGAYFKKGNVLAPSTLYWDRLTVTG